MSQTVLVATSGRATGSPAARRLRAEGRIPGVVYGHGMTPLSISVERRDLRLALSGPAGVNTVLELHVDGAKYPAVIREMQRHPVKRTVSHVDFLQVNMNETITVFVPLRLHGEAKAVLNNGGLVDPSVDQIEVSTTPANMPDELVVDITAMQLGDVIRLSEVTMPEGVTALGDPDMAVASAIMATKVEAPPAEGTEADGGAAASDATE